MKHAAHTFILKTFCTFVRSNKQTYMHKINISILSFVVTLALVAIPASLSAQNSNNQNNMETNNFDRISYALGLSMGNNFRSSGIQQLNVQDFADGVAAVMNGATPKMTYDEAKEEIRKFFTEMEAKQKAEAAKMADINKAAGEQFLAENGKRAEVITLPSGLQYEVLTEGTGTQPTAQDQVEVHYTGKLIDGTVFDSSVDRGVPATFGVTQVIPGWVEALQLMKAGSKWRLFIPSQLAYGANGAGGVIGPNATLIFDVELIKVIGK